jgi:histidine triad (HIT) family protein
MAPLVDGQKLPTNVGFSVTYGWRTQSDCLVCNKHASGDALGCGVIYEDDLVFASHAFPQTESGDAYLGYLFVETKRHVAGIGELTASEAAAVGLLVNDLGTVLRSSEGAVHVYAHVYGDGVPHFHVHLQARYPGTPREYWPKAVGTAAIIVSLAEWPQAPRGDMQSVRSVSCRLRDAVEQIRSARTSFE